MTTPTLSLDLSNCDAQRIGPRHGLDSDAPSRGRAAAPTLTERLRAMRETGKTRWRDLAHGAMRAEHLHGVQSLVGEIHDEFAAESLRGRCENLIVLGIGGSALGNLALQSALRSPMHNLLESEARQGPRLFVLDNVDPEQVGAVLSYLDTVDPDLQHTLLNVISKSGETAETAAQFLIFRDMFRKRLGPARAARQIIAVTDPKSGTMRAIADREGYRTLPVPDGVGGRFSVLSPVGLFSAAMCGIDIGALLDGAAVMDCACSAVEFDANPALRLAWTLMEFTKRGKGNHVLMPYASSLYLLADWYRQLWAESLGKRVDLQGREVFAGATPIKALGATDQHSQVQLYREGPNNKVIGFIEVDSFREDAAIPSGMNVDALTYLEGRTLSQLLNAEKRATEYALLESERPNYTIRFPEITERQVGEFFMLWEVTTAYAGLLLNINAYDQPAVETGKVATFGLMGRPGYEEWKQKVEARLGG